MMHLDVVLNGEDNLELTLPSFRMVVLTDETLEVFFSSNFPESFSLKTVAADSQKSLGREIFDHLFVSGQTLASRKHLSPSVRGQSPSLSPSVSQLTNSPSSARSSPSVTPTGNDMKDDLIDLLGTTSLESTEKEDESQNAEKASPKKNLPLDELFKEFEHFDADDGYQLI